MHDHPTTHRELINLWAEGNVAAKALGRLAFSRQFLNSYNQEIGTIDRRTKAYTVSDLDGRTSQTTQRHINLMRRVLNEQGYTEQKS